MHDASLTHLALILIVLFAAVANTATNIAPAPDPPQRQTKTVRPGNVLLPRRRRKVLGGGANSPPCNLLRVYKITFELCHVVRTQHHQPTTPGAETIQTEGRGSIPWTI